MTPLYIVLRQEAVAGGALQTELDAATAFAAEQTLRDGEPRVVVQALTINERVTKVDTRPFEENNRRG